MCLLIFFYVYASAKGKQIKKLKYIFIQWAGYIKRTNIKMKRIMEDRILKYDCKNKH